MSGSDSGQRLARADRLRSRADYLRCYRQGRRQAGPLFNLHTHDNALDHPRLGITASRKVGKAVVRGLLKRRVREVFRRSELRTSLGGLDLVVHLQPAAARAGFAELKLELDRSLSRAVARRQSRSRP
ncbi:MAG TPA: ribonuclease P protein component [Thermoanaerobaculia bacterium]|nr:ribonuclease P protein component [Thermoanaerobaculia bacterium]